MIIYNLLLQMSALVLINALIVNADGLDFKIHLRSEFCRCGLVAALSNLRSQIDLDEQLKKQIEIFDKHARENFEEMEASYENIEAMWDGNC
jgi:diaphanous 3